MRLHKLDNIIQPLKLKKKALLLSTDKNLLLSVVLQMLRRRWWEVKLTKLAFKSITQKHHAVFSVK